MFRHMLLRLPGTPKHRATTLSGHAWGTPFVDAQHSCGIRQGGRDMLHHLRRLGLLASLVTLAFSSVLSNPATAQLAKTCGARTVSQPFAPWLDLGHYFLFPGGDLEAASGWTLAGGARLVAGNEPFLVHAGGDTQSLLLPSGSSARTAAACFDTDEPTLRFFVRNTGSPP